MLGFALSVGFFDLSFFFVVYVFGLGALESGSGDFHASQMNQSTESTARHTA